VGLGKWAEALQPWGGTLRGGKNIGREFEVHVRNMHETVGMAIKELQ
jgi:hypothetical protein